MSYDHGLLHVTYSKNQNHIKKTANYENCKISKIV